MTAAAQSQLLERALPETVTLQNVSWELYEHLLKERDRSGQHLKITYDRGTLIIMSPLRIHERIKRFLGQIVEMITLELDIPRASYGSSTWKRQDVRGGTEPDECYYIGREPKTDDWKPADLPKDPPPDLAIEVDITRNSRRKLDVYARLKVREVWLFDGQEVTIYRLKRDGRYEPVSPSRLLSVLSADQINKFVRKFLASGEMAAVRAVRRWIKSL